MTAQVNGDVPSSAFLAHLKGYPVIEDSLNAITQTPLGQKSLHLADQGYNAFAKPVLPYFQKPYQYVHPYVVKADSIGDHTLSKVDEKFPVVHKPTGELVDNAKGYAFFPLRKTLEGKDYVFKTYSSECKKVGGEGVVTMGKAAVTTTLIVTSDALTWLSGFLAAKKEQAKQVASEKKEQMQQ
jgi:hypothetical protein